MKEIPMTYIKLLLGVLLLAAFVPMAHSQDDAFVLNHTEIGKHQRPLSSSITSSMRKSWIADGAIMILMHS